VSPSGRLPSCLTNPEGSLVAGMLAESKDHQVMSFRTWCLETLPGAFLHTIAWRPWASTWSPRGQLCGAHRARPSRIPTATRTASSSSLRPQLAIGRARSQSPLYGATGAKNLAFCGGSAKESSTSAQSFYYYYYYCYYY